MSDPIHEVTLPPCPHDPDGDHRPEAGTRCRYCEPNPETALHAWRMVGTPYSGPLPSLWLWKLIERSGLRIVVDSPCWWMEARR